jgi:hypothetical protein
LVAYLGEGILFPIAGLMSGGLIRGGDFEGVAGYSSSYSDEKNRMRMMYSMFGKTIKDQVVYNAGRVIVGGM